MRVSVTLVKIISAIDWMSLHHLDLSAKGSDICEHLDKGIVEYCQIYLDNFIWPSDSTFNLAILKSIFWSRMKKKNGNEICKK